MSDTEKEIEVDGKNVFAKYPHLESLSKIQDILLEPEIVATEKIHGTNARVGYINGKVRIGGRNNEHTNDDGNSVMGFTTWVRESGLAKRLKEYIDHERVDKDENIIFYGEWFGSNIQKGIQYGPEKQFRVFDVRIDGEMVDWDLVKIMADQVDLKVVPELYRGSPDINKLEALLDVVSVVAKEVGIDDEKNLHEGIVVKALRMKRSQVYGEWLIAKFKPARSTERQSSKKNQTFTPIPGEVGEFVNEFVTDTRLEHVIDHLRDQGINVVDMTSTSHVMKEMNLDVIREGADEIDKLLLHETVEWKAVSKMISKKTGVLLRQYLNNLLVNKTGG